MTADSARRWFGRVVWLGIAANAALAVPTLAAPARMIALTGLPPATPDLWVRFAAFLLLLLSAFYAPGAIDPRRYRAAAWLSVLARLGGVCFFATQAREYWVLGAFDFVFLVPEAVLLGRGLRASPPSQGQSAS